MNIYMAVTNDKYELPVAFGETLSELAMMVDSNPSNISRNIKNYKTAKRHWGKYRYVKVEIEDEEQT